MTQENYEIIEDILRNERLGIMADNPDCPINGLPYTELVDYKTLIEIQDRLSSYSKRRNNIIPTP